MNEFTLGFLTGASLFVVLVVIKALLDQRRSGKWNGCIGIHFVGEPSDQYQYFQESAIELESGTVVDKILLCGAQPGATPCVKEFGLAIDSPTGLLAYTSSVSLMGIQLILAQPQAYYDRFWCLRLILIPDSQLQQVSFSIIWKEQQHPQGSTRGMGDFSQIFGALPHGKARRMRRVNDSAP